MLEIGAYHGRSTVALAQTAKLVVSVDWHRGDEGSGFGWTLPQFAATLDRLGLWDRVIPVVGKVVPAAMFLSPCFDLAWVDGAHDELSVATDTWHALRLLKPDGVLAWHDWDYETVKAGVARHPVITAVAAQPNTRIGTWTQHRETTT